MQSLSNTRAPSATTDFKINRRCGEDFTTWLQCSLHTVSLALFECIYTLFQANFKPQQWLRESAWGIWLNTARTKPCSKLRMHYIKGTNMGKLYTMDCMCQPKARHVIESTVHYDVFTLKVSGWKVEKTVRIELGFLRGWLTDTLHILATLSLVHGPYSWMEKGTYFQQDDIMHPTLTRTAMFKVDAG